MQLDQTIEQRKATQNMRLFDMGILSPALLWLGLTHKNPLAKLFLVGAGIGTFLYNKKRYTLEKKYLDAMESETK